MTKKEFINNKKQNKKYENEVINDPLYRFTIPYRL